MRKLIAALAGALLLAATLGLAGPGTAGATPAGHDTAFSLGSAARATITVYPAYNICWVLNPNREPNGYGIVKTNQFSFTDSAHTIHEYTQCSYMPNRPDLPNYGNGCRLYDQAQPLNGPERDAASDFVPSAMLNYPLICPR